MDHSIRIARVEIKLLLLCSLFKAILVTVKFPVMCNVFCSICNIFCWNNFAPSIFIFEVSKLYTNNIPSSIYWAIFDLWCVGWHPVKHNNTEPLTEEGLSFYPLNNSFKLSCITRGRAVINWVFYNQRNHSDKSQRTQTIQWMSQNKGKWNQWNVFACVPLV